MPPRPILLPALNERTELSHMSPRSEASNLYIGLMSGTSLDGIDGVLVDFSRPRLHTLAHVAQPFSNAFRTRLLALQTSGPDELHRSALAANELAQRYTEVIHSLLRKTQQQASMVAAIGAHGQTVRHQPQSFDSVGYTLQLNNPALLAELSGIGVVADFRSRDVAAGGQGAPLVPAFHARVFGRTDAAVAVLNLGGIANLSLIPPLKPSTPTTEPSAHVLGFDCGPANVLMDAWCQQHLGLPYDADGGWAATGKVHENLLGDFLSDEFFSQTPPKSTGRDRFNETWLLTKLGKHAPLPPRDVQATLLALTATSVARDLQRFAPHSEELIVCGGGALNTTLLAALEHRCQPMPVRSSEVFGLPPLQVEATAFAWLAQQLLERKQGNIPKVTGARGARLLGCFYPA
jgi:anhydro-N-acetylmuramic acid kinase